MIALLALGLAGASGQRLSQHVPLFDGRTFAGWEGDTATTWRIERRALAGGSLGAPLPHHEYLRTTRTFANFDLRVKVKLVGDGVANGGVTFRARRLADPPNEVSGYQADMGESYWGGLYDQSRRNRFLAQPEAAEVAKILKPNDRWPALPPRSGRAALLRCQSIGAVIQWHAPMFPPRPVRSYSRSASTSTGTRFAARRGDTAKVSSGCSFALRETLAHRHGQHLAREVGGTAPAGSGT